MLIKKNTFDRLVEDWMVMLKDIYEETAADRNRVVIPVLEEQGVCHRIDSLFVIKNSYN